MVEKESTVWGRILQLVENLPTVGLRQIGKAKVFTRQTDLVRDLGLVGDDAFEFMENYAACLNVKTGDFDWSDYFDPEGLWPLPKEGKPKKKKLITLGMLEMAAIDGEWDSNKLSQIK
jgi:Protein of unknown function (DUF1493)